MAVCAQKSLRRHNCINKGNSIFTGYVLCTTKTILSQLIAEEQNLHLCDSFLGNGKHCFPKNLSSYPQDHRGERRICSTKIDFEQPTYERKAWFKLKSYPHKLLHKKGIFL